MNERETKYLKRKDIKDVVPKKYDNKVGSQIPISVFEIASALFKFYEKINPDEILY